MTSLPPAPERSLPRALPTIVLRGAVAGAIDRAGAEKAENFGIGREGDRHDALDRVAAGIRRLQHEIRGGVHDIDVVAGSAAHDVGAGPAH